MNNEEPKKQEEQTPAVEYAYRIEDKVFGEFFLRKSDNAWWMNRTKVENLISAFKFDATIEEACAYAGISRAQYQYFIEQHPVFSEIKEACRQLPTLSARKSVVDELPKNPALSMDYLSRKKKDEFSSRTENVNIQDALVEETHKKILELEKLVHQEHEEKIKKENAQTTPATIDAVTGEALKV